MKWYTCTPVPFKGDHTFFSRDSGAFCKAFQRIGLESRAIMPTPVQEGDDPDLIRTEYANLEDAAWWKSLGIDGLVLYAWGTGKYLPIARAIHDAGIFLVVYMDSSGLFFPWQYWLPIAENMWTRDVFARGKIRGTAFFLLRLLKQHTWNLASRGRRKHLDQGDMVAFPMPAAVKSIQDREWHGNLPEDLRARIRLAGYLPNAELQKKYSQARISLCTSRSEGTHVASAEALCAGASVVGPRLTPLLNCLQWYVSHDSGTLSPKDTPESVSGALLEEIRAWDEGKRSPEEISRYWCSLLHAENSCKRIIAAYEAAKGGS